MSTPEDIPGLENLSPVRRAAKNFAKLLRGRGVAGLLGPYAQIVTARAVAEYTGLLLFPWHLHMERDVETHPSGYETPSLNAASWRELQPLLGLILIAAAGYALWRSRRQPAIFQPSACNAPSRLQPWPSKRASWMSRISSLVRSASSSGLATPSSRAACRPGR
jgi:hypothetical protein